MNFKKSLAIIFLAIGAMAFFVSCTKIRDEIPVTFDCIAIDAKFITVVNPIIQSYCAINI